MTALEAFTVPSLVPSLSRQIKLSSLCHFFVHLDVNTSTHNGTFVQFTHTLKLVHSTRQGLEDPKRTSAVPDGSSSCAALLLSLSWANLNFCGWTARRSRGSGRGIERGGQVCLLTVGCDCCTQSATHCYTRFSLPPSCFPSFPSSSSSPPTYFKALRPQHFWQLRRALLGSNYMLAFSRVGKQGQSRRWGRGKWKLGRKLSSSSMRCGFSFAFRSLDWKNLVLSSLAESFKWMKILKHLHWA